MATTFALFRTLEQFIWAFGKLLSFYRENTSRCGSLEVAAPESTYEYMGARLGHQGVGRS